MAQLIQEATAWSLAINKNGYAFAQKSITVLFFYFCVISSEPNVLGHSYKVAKQAELLRCHLPAGSFLK